MLGSYLGMTTSSLPTGRDSTGLNAGESESPKSRLPSTVGRLRRSATLRRRASHVDHERRRGRSRAGGADGPARILRFKTTQGYIDLAGETFGEEA